MGRLALGVFRRITSAIGLFTAEKSWEMGVSRS